MERELQQCGRNVKVHVTEIYSPPRVNAMAEKINMNPGFSLDLTVNDPEDGMPWDFNNRGKREKAKKLIQEKRALLVIGSSRCKTSTLQK